jgi:hypothetical protein
MENSGDIVPGGPVKLWLPGLGATDPRVRACARAVERYDAALRLARHEITGDWVVTIGERGNPVFGFGKELPHPDDVEKKLAAHDIKRQYKQITDHLAREAELKRLDAQYRMEEQNGELAEHLEVGFRHQKAHPQARIFVTGRKRNRRGN